MNTKAHRHSSTHSPSNSMPRDGNCQLALVPPITTASFRFKLPRGWGVRKVIRRDGSREDRYFYEPGTGNQFRSMKEVQRYLNGEGHRCRSNRKSYNVDSCERSDLAIVASGIAARMEFNSLPDGWFVEEVPRKYNTKWIDRYYYEPGTGRKFRSLISVKRYLEENAPLSQALEQIKENKPLSKVFKLENNLKKSARENNISGHDTEHSSYIGPPMKVNWVLASPRGDTWNPFISEMLVPDSVMKQWASRFTVFVNDGISDGQSSCA